MVTPQPDQWPLAVPVAMLDALFALSGSITRPDFDAFFKLAANVLAEEDPSLELPEDELPVEGVAIILGVDELMDMARTSVNLLGNCLATAVVARWEGVALETGATRTDDIEVVA